MSIVRVWMPRLFALLAILWLPDGWMIKSGFKDTTVSMLGLIMPPMLGSWQAVSGYLQ